MHRYPSENRLIRPDLFYVGSISLFSLFACHLSAQCPLTVDAGPDQWGCSDPFSTQLTGAVTGPFEHFFWTPASGLSSPDVLTPTATVTQPAVYVLQANTTDTTANLVLNGHFELGNTGFETDYAYNPGFTANPRFGTYEIAALPSQTFPLCPDHTSGAGQYMIIDGADVPGLRVWQQTVPVTPQTFYRLSFWVVSFHEFPPFAVLQASVNGLLLGTVAQADQNCAWRHFTVDWYNDDQTLVELAIDNLIVAADYNDFGLDDIALWPICSVQDTVRVIPVAVDAQAEALVYLPATGDTVSLNGSGRSTHGDVAFQWSTPDGLVVAGANSPRPLVTQPGTYLLTVTDTASGCTDTASTLVALQPNRKVYAPNVFSPNDDGENDRFTLFGAGISSINSLQIFDRWGSLVWAGVHLEPGNEPDGWDGRVRGFDPAPGVYTWQADVFFTDGYRELLAGNVTLVR